MRERTIVFICEHGAAKSVLAAAYLRQLAGSRGIAVRALARGTDPDPTISPAASAGLQAAGLPVPEEAPTQPVADELASAWAVVSFGPRLDDSVPRDVRYLSWPDVPAVSDGFDAARDAIVTHLTHLLETM